MLSLFHVTVSIPPCHHLAMVDTRCYNIFWLLNSFLSSVDVSYAFWNLTLLTHTWLRQRRLLTLAASDECPSAKQKLFCFWPLERIVTQGKRQKAEGLSHFRQQIQQNTGELNKWVVGTTHCYRLEEVPLCLSISVTHVTVTYSSHN